MFGLSSSSFNASKLKAQLKMGVGRIELLKNKKSALLKQSMKQIAELLVTEPPQIEKAKIRTEALIRDDNYIEACEIIQLNCELLHERIKLIELSKECPVDMIGVIGTIMWSSQRIDVPELVLASKQLTAKFGTKFTDQIMNSHLSATNNGGNNNSSNNNSNNDGNGNSVCYVNERVVAKLSFQPPAAYLVNVYLEKICQLYEVPIPWNQDNQQQGGGGGNENSLLEPVPPPVGYSVPVAHGTGLGTSILPPTAPTPPPAPSAPALPTTRTTPTTDQGNSQNNKNDNDDDQNNDDPFIPPPLPPSNSPYDNNNNNNNSPRGGGGGGSFLSNLLGKKEIMASTGQSMTGMYTFPTVTPPSVPTTSTTTTTTSPPPEADVPVVQASTTALSMSDEVVDDDDTSSMDMRLKQLQPAPRNVPGSMSTLTLQSTDSAARLNQYYGHDSDYQEVAAALASSEDQLLSSTLPPVPPSTLPRGSIRQPSAILAPYKKELDDLMKNYVDHFDHTTTTTTNKNKKEEEEEEIIVSPSSKIPLDYRDDDEIATVITTKTGHLSPTSSTTNNKKSSPATEENLYGHLEYKDLVTKFSQLTK